MSDLDETDTSCGEEQIVSDWEVRKEWLESMLSKYHEEQQVSFVHDKRESTRIYRFVLNTRIYSNLAATICLDQDAIF